jgi:hypothetical protein
MSTISPWSDARLVLQSTDGWSGLRRDPGDTFTIA